MPKLNEVLKEINRFVNSDELELLASEAEFTHEITDEAFVRIQSLMSEEAALNNSEIENKFKDKLYPTFKKSILGNIDKELVSMGSALFGDEAAMKIKSGEWTQDKIREFIRLTQETLKNSNGDGKSKEQIEALTERINAINEDHAKALQDKETEVLGERAKFENSLVKNKFMSLASEYNWAEPYADTDTRSIILGSIYQKISESATLRPNEQGEIELFAKDNPDQKMFDGGVKIELKALLDKEMSKYVSKGTPQPHSRTKEPERRVTDLPKNPMLQDLRKSREDFGIQN